MDRFPWQVYLHALMGNLHSWIALRLWIVIVYRYYQQSSLKIEFRIWFVWLRRIVDYRVSGKPWESEFFFDAIFDALPDIAILYSDLPLTTTATMKPHKAVTRSKTAQKHKTTSNEPALSTVDTESTLSVTESITDVIAEVPHAGQSIFIYPFSNAWDFKKLTLHP